MLKNSTDLSLISEECLLEFNTFCRTFGLMGKVTADHVGLKCSSIENYEYQKSLFDFESRFIYQSIISNRRISVIGLNEGLETVVGPLMYLELADQKPDGSQRDSIDHIEIVPLAVTYESVVASLKAQGVELIEITRPHHTTYDIKLPSGFTIKLSRGMLVEKIKIGEMK